MERKSAGGSIFQILLQAQMIPWERESRSEPRPRVITVVFEVLRNVQGFVFVILIVTKSDNEKLLRVLAEVPGRT